MIDPKFTYAVIWASNNTEKYWYKVFKDLLEKWFKVIPINPKEENYILGEKVYSTLPDYDWTIDIVIFVVPPVITLEILKKMTPKDSISRNRLGFKSVWFQPGASDKNCIDFCKDNNIKYIADACIMIQNNISSWKSR